jgi:organic radical activating enzyme
MCLRAKASGTQIVVITGGEPVMYDLSILTQRLKSFGLRTHIETSGVYPLSGIWDWVCFSPKNLKVLMLEFSSKQMNLKSLFIIRVIALG